MLVPFSFAFCCAYSVSHKRLQQKILFFNQRISHNCLCNQLQRPIFTALPAIQPVLLLQSKQRQQRKTCKITQILPEKFIKSYKRQTKKKSVFSLANSLQESLHKKKSFNNIKKQGLELAKQKFSQKKPHLFFAKVNTETPFYKTLHNKCSAVKAINSCLYMGPCPSMFNPYNVWSPSMYNFLQGHRENHAVLAFEKTTQKFLESLHLCALIRRRGGSIYVIFDHDSLPSKSLQAETSKTRFVDSGILLDVDTSRRLTVPSKHALLALQSKQSKARNKASFYKQSKSFAIPDESIKKLSSGFRTFPGYETLYGWSSEKWVGGTFSNFQQVSKSVSLYGTLSRQFFRFLQQNKNVSSRYTAMHMRFRGNVLSQTAYSCKNFKSFLHASKVNTPIHLCFRNTPDVIIVESANKNRNVIQEAHALNIPVISFADSDVAEQILSKISIGIGLNIYKRSLFYSLLYYIYKIPVYK